MRVFWIVFFLFVSAKELFAQDFASANRLLTERKYAEAEKMYSDLLKENPKNALANFGFARTIFLHTREIVHMKRNQNSLWESWLPEYERLKNAYIHALTAQEEYRKADAKQKKTFSVSGIADVKEINALLEGIPKEAFDLIEKSHFRKSYDALMKLQPFNEPQYLDTLLRLREIVTEMSIDYESAFKNNRNLPLVKTLRKPLLSDYTNIPSLRRNGTGYGFLYEKFCKNILKDCDENDLKHILREFYGADYERDEFVTFEAFSEKIQALAADMRVSPLQFLCEMNLHHVGVSAENVVFYEKFIEKIAPAEIAWVALQKLAGFYLNREGDEKSAACYLRFESGFPQKKGHITKILQILRSAPDDIQLSNLGADINTAGDETHPVAMPDGAGLFFCRKNHGSGQDIYAAYKKGSGYEVRPLPAPVNTNTHEVPINISFDKSLFVFFGNYGTLPQYKDVLQAGSLGRGDLFYSALREEKFGINVFPPPLNSPDYEGGLCFTADGKAAIFVSDRTGAVGGYFPKSPPNRLFYHGGEDFNTDLWISFKKNDTWSEPVNLGNLNTPFAESNPYLHPDMKTIYFVSDGHAGLGGGDIFVATRLDDTWQNWSEPQNLGKSVNTPEKDGFFTDAYGQFAYIALKNKKPSFGGSDIYRFEIPERFRPKKTVKITGNLLHEGKGTSGKIIVEDLADGKKVSETYADAKTGKFEFELQSGKNYGVFSEKSGFYGESASLSMTDKNNKANLRLETSSIKELIEKQKPLRLVNIFFETNSAELLPESESELRRLADMLRENKNLKIRVEGHTDNTGNANANLVLSERRAQSVADFLIRQGVPEDRVFYKGFGQEYPIADNKTEEGRAKNRRVEFSLKAR